MFDGHCNPSWLIELTNREGFGRRRAKECTLKGVKQAGEPKEHTNRFECLTPTCRGTRSQRESCALGYAGGRKPSCVERPVSVYVGDLFACRDCGSSFHWPVQPCVWELCRFEHTDSHTMQKRTMKRGARMVWRRFASRPKYYPQSYKKAVTTNGCLPFIAPPSLRHKLSRGTSLTLR
jgi:hypothetical protein